MQDKQIIVCENGDALARWAAQRFVQTAARAFERGERFTVALAGGSTPRRLYELLATPQWSAAVSWNRVHVFWGDERHVPPDDAESNYRMAREALLDHVPLPAENVHRIKTENDAERAAQEYERELREFFAPDVGSWPRFDLVLLGLGPDGHTASLFPGTTVLHETVRWVAAPWVPKFSAHRVTLTLPIINNAAEVLFLASGQEKAAKLREVLQETPHPAPPAQLVRPHNGELRWAVDKAAAGELAPDTVHYV